MRTYTDLASSSDKTLLASLSNSETDVTAYRDAMYGLGKSLSLAIYQKVQPEANERFCVVCTAEDADFLAKGMLDGFRESGVLREKLSLVCFWNGRFNSHVEDDEDYDVAPVVKEYREPYSLKESYLIVAKSIISTACVVKTNLSTMIEEGTPKRVFVAAPVMYKDADKRLASQFAESVSKSFEYVTFAQDDEKSADGKVVLPGVGGSIYQRLGVGNVLSYIPQIVKDRRKELATC